VNSLIAQASLSILLIFGYVQNSYSDTGADLSTYVLPSTLLYVLAIVLPIICLVQLYILLKYRKSLSKLIESEEKLGAEHQKLEKKLVERSEKLHNINNQLYDEIAKHEITEELLRETQDYIQNIINSMPSILIGVTREGIITHWNTAARQATSINYDKALGFLLNDIAPELNIDSELIDRAIDLQKPQKRENRQQGHGSQATFSDLTIYPLLSSDIEGAVIRIDDVTLRVRLETMMIQNEKMNSLGELAAGVAHEINNPLGTILQSIQNIRRRISDDLPANQAAASEIGLSLTDLNDYLNNRQIIDFIDDIKEAGERTRLIVKNMLEFSRAQDAQYDSVNIVELLDRSIELALNSMSANQADNNITTTIDKTYPENRPQIPCSAVEIQQVILNLLSNAYHAFIDNTANVELGTELRIHIKLSFTDKDAVIEIQDNGPGMDSWTQRHVFDPFFTTKEVGKGTGLGLSVTYFIITEHHQGSIAVDSAVGEGTTFIIHLPLEEH
jgi:PAS domain S-box-containing protein